MEFGREARNAFYVTAAFIIALSFVTWIVVPVQSLFLPEVTVFAALVFPPHGVRVLSAWLFGWRSVLYLLIAALLAHPLLTPDVAFGAKTVAGMVISAVSAAVAFWMLERVYRNFRTNRAESGRATWRGLVFVAVASSTINSLGQNLLFAQEIWPVGTLNVFAAFLVGDCLGTWLAFVALTVILHLLRGGKSQPAPPNFGASGQDR